jgi:hypothetical protein
LGAITFSILLCYNALEGSLVDDNNELIEEEKYIEKLDVDDE